MRVSLLLARGSLARSVTAARPLADQSGEPPVGRAQSSSNEALPQTVEHVVN